MTALLENPFLPSLFAFLAVTMATLVIVDFISFASARYKERYLEEAAVELDDVLLQLPPGKILDLSLAISAVAFFMAVVIFASTSNSFSWPKGIFLGMVLAIVTFPMPRLILKQLRIHRLIKFNEQLEDALGSISSSLKAGFNINQALETIASENRRPISVEFRLLVQEIRLGVQLEQALDNMNRRLGSDDFELVVTAIITARQTGGKLTAVLERLASVIRERARINNKLRAMTAQGKLQAVIIGIMPFALMFFMSWASPTTMDNFFGSLLGIMAIIGASILVVIGFLVIRKITTIDV
ncbi:MAG: type II secretion system F family protein [Victivallaceae bacterium]